jgi:type IV pilus biogenesis/stability protein PilW
MHHRVLSLILIGIYLVALTSCHRYHEKKEKQKKTAEAYYNLGIQYLNDGDYPSALLELRKAASVQPSNHEVHNAIGLVYYYTNRPEDAEKEYKEAISLDKKYSEAYVNLGSLYAQQGKFDKAIVQYKKALKNPFYSTPALAQHNIGLIYRKMGNLQEAESAFKETIQQDPNFIRGYFDLGMIYYENNQMEEAIETLSAAIQHHPVNEEDPRMVLSLANLHYWLALAYFKNSDTNNSVIHFQEVTRLTSNNELSEEANKYLDLLQ